MKKESSSKKKPRSSNSVSSKSSSSKSGSPESISSESISSESHSPESGSSDSVSSESRSSESGSSDSVSSESRSSASASSKPTEKRTPDGRLKTQKFQPKSEHIAVYPGSFDPVTLGHLNVMERISRLFDRVIIGVGVNYDKQGWFSPQERIKMIEDSTRHLPNIEVRVYEGLTVKFARQCGAKIMVRGVRPITDIPAEMTMMMANRQLAPDVETLFMVADGELAHVSSSLIKEIASVADMKTLRSFLSEPVVQEVHRFILEHHLSVIEK